MSTGAGELWGVFTIWMENTMDDATLCREVAVKVMGESIHGWRTVSLDGNTVIRVVEKMREKGFDLYIRSMGIGKYVVQFSNTSMEVGSTAHADTMPRAVFLAALKAMGVQSET